MVRSTSRNSRSAWLSAHHATAFGGDILFRVTMAVPTTTTSGTSFPLMRGGHIQAKIDLTSTTTFKQMGVTAPTSANVMPGEQVIAGGSWVAATLTLTAKTLRIIPVQSVSYPCAVKTPPVTDSHGNVSFTVKCGGKRIYTVDVTSTTKYSENHVKNPSVSNVKVGEHVVIIGRAYGYPISTIISASAVHIAEATPGGAESGRDARLARPDSG